MEEVKLICGNCGEETSRPPKPEPKNAREGRQVRFHCEYCGARNLRDGSVIPRTLEVKEDPKEIQEEPEKKESGDGGKLALLSVAIAGFVAIVYKLWQQSKAKPQEPGAREPSPFDVPH
jgi:DNA-directed RNA polymerase subunit RPC12/RpoP